MNVKELRDEYLRYSKRMLEAASDPSSPGVDFAHQCRIAQLAAMVAYLADALANYTASSVADSVANELGELASAGEPLADWVDERLDESASDGGMPEPCQPIGCDNGHHLAGCVYAAADAEEAVDRG